MTRKALADMVGVSGRAVGTFEDGVREPAEETLSRIAFALRLPQSFFLQPDLDLIEPEAVSFRARRAMTAAIRDQALAALEVGAGLISPAFRHWLDLPAVQVPDLSEEHPEQAALQLRQMWRMGEAPIKSVLDLVEARGIEVYWTDVSSTCVDAVSCWRDDKPFILLNTTKTAGERARFDLCHELGHLCLHRQRADIVGREAEREADRFAAAFLLPPGLFRQECPKYPILQQFFPLKQRWGASIQSMVRRCRDVGVFTEWQYESACRSIAARGWRTAEPYSLHRERSRLNELTFRALAEMGIYPQNIAEELYIRVEDLKELTQIPPLSEGTRKSPHGREITIGELQLTIVNG